MDTDLIRQSPANPRIKRILKCYQQSAERSLNGPYESERGGVQPGGGMVRVFEGHRYNANTRTVARDPTAVKGPWKRSGPALNQEIGFNNGADVTEKKPGVCEIAETVLEGQKIACFEVGGEQRLCMPQILSAVLRDFDPAQVLKVCEELHIFFSRCDPEQLDALKRANILPQHVTTCGLVTFTNAERICSTLLRNQTAYKYRLPVAVEGLKVYHEIFGGCQGIFVAEAFDHPSAKCVQCAECGEMFAPSQFVSHSHSELENGTIHWGFSPTNWKAYLMLSLDQTGFPGVLELLDSLKNKFDDDNAYCKTEKVVVKEEVDEGTPVKRTRLENLGNLTKTRNSPSPSKWVPADVGGAWQFCVSLCRQLDTIKNRLEAKPPHFLNTETPFLADADRVIPYDESQWADRNFAPNVSLDPVPYKNLHDQYYDECAEKEPVDDENDVATAMPCHKWSSSLLTSSCNVSTVVRLADSGNVSDDEDDNESVLSDKLPAINEDDGQSCDRISNIWNARLGLLIRALEGELHRSSAAGQDPMQEFLNLQKQHSDIVNTVADTNINLSQRRLYLWTLMEDKLRAMEELRKNQDEELACLKHENAMKMREAMIERCRLMDQIEKLSNGSIDSDLAKQATRYRDEAEMLKTQLQKAEEMNASLRREISKLHRAIETLTHPASSASAAASDSEHGGRVSVPLVVKPELVGAAMNGPRLGGWHMVTSSASICPQGV